MSKRKRDAETSDDPKTKRIKQEHQDDEVQTKEEEANICKSCSKVIEGWEQLCSLDQKKCTDCKGKLHTDKECCKIYGVFSPCCTKCSFCCVKCNVWISKKYNQKLGSREKNPTMCMSCRWLWSMW